MSESFVKQIENGYIPEVDDNVFSSLFQEYERVVVDSLITSFALDTLINDQYGGDVDTINNVRKIKSDPTLNYKNRQNEEAYLNRGAYSTGAYHSARQFSEKKKAARYNLNITDEYDGGTIGFYSRHAKIIDERRANLDHIISAKEIHEDRGRVLSGLNGVDLANNETNFAWTNESLNKSKQASSVESFIKRRPDLPEETKAKLREKDKIARSAYNEAISLKYYTSSSFLKDCGKAAANVGIRMGLRQALGLVFAEIWLAVKETIKKFDKSGVELFKAIGNAVIDGLERAKSKYKELWERFIKGIVAGCLASVTTTIKNIFITTSENYIRILRQSWVSIVDATNIIMFNPDCLPYGERLRAAAKVIATGASIVIGSMVEDKIAKTGLGKIPVIGDIVSIFVSSMITGIMCCSLLYILDHEPTIEKIVQTLNSIPSHDDVVTRMRVQSDMLKEYSAKLFSISDEEFRKEESLFRDATRFLEENNTQADTNRGLKEIYAKLGYESPYGADINEFMRDTQSRLVFR